MAEAQTIAQELKMHRKARQLTQEQFARELGIPAHTLNGWELGRISSNMIAFAKAVIRVRLHHGSVSASTTAAALITVNNAVKAKVPLKGSDLDYAHALVRGWGSSPDPRVNGGAKVFDDSLVDKTFLPLQKALLGPEEPKRRSREVARDDIPDLSDDEGSSLSHPEPSRGRRVTGRRSVAKPAR